MCDVCVCVVPPTLCDFETLSAFHRLVILDCLEI